MADKPPRFSYPVLGKTITGSYPTPIVDDVIVIVNKEVNAPGYQVEAYGSPHPDSDKYPQHKLALIQAAEDGVHAKWFYVADRANQDLYNWALKYKLEDQTSSIYIRQYILPRDGYTPLPNGTPDSADTSAQLIHEEVTGAAEGELASLYIKVVRVFEHLPGPILLTQTLKNSGYALIPPEFRQNDNQNIKIQEVATGTLPDQATGTILESQVEPIDTVKANKRNTILIPGTVPVLVSTLTNKAKQVATQTRSLVNTGTTPPSPSAVQTVTVEDLGNGKSVQTVTTDPSLFPASRYEASKPDLTPEEFRATINDTSTATTVTGTAAPPVLDPTSLSKSEEQLDVFTKRTTSVNRARPALPTTLTESDTNEAKQVVTVSKTLQSSLAPNPAPSALQDVTVRNLGDGRVVQTVRSVPSLFSADYHEAEQLDLTPVEFRATIKQTTDESTVEGTAGQPILGTNDLSASERQINAFVKRTSVTSRPKPSLPAVLTGKDTDRDRQIVTVTKKLRLSGTDPTPNATTQVEVTPLGDGRVVEIVRSVPQVFARNVYEADRPETVPREFLWANPATETSVDSAGNASPPILGSNDISITQEQIDAFTKRVRTRTRPISNTVLTGRRLVQEYGGQKATVTRSLQAAGGTLDSEDTNFQVVSASIDNLGNGKELKEVVTADSPWPTLQDWEVDRELDAVISVQRSVIAYGNEEGQIGAFSDTQYRALDKRRRLKTVTGFKDQNTLNNYSRVWQGQIDIWIPPELYAVVASVAVQGAGGGLGSANSAGLFTNTAGRLSGSVTANANAAIMMQATPYILQRSGHNIPCQHVLFLSPANATRTSLLQKIGQILGLPVNDWPHFSPVSTTLIVTGQNVETGASSGIEIITGITQDYQGHTVGVQAGAVSSGSIRQNITVHSQIIHIEPTIHPAIPITGSPNGSISSQTYGATASIGGIIQTNYAAATATGAVYGTIPATPGATAVPTSGLYLVALQGEPYRFGQIKYRATVINAANLA